MVGVGVRLVALMANRAELRVAARLLSIVSLYAVLRGAIQIREFRYANVDLYPTEGGADATWTPRMRQSGLC
jgi:hypothetical protein